MALQINDTAPDFTAESTEGPIKFHDGSATRGRCCSRIRRTSPRSARPSSATWRRIKPEFDRRNVKIIGLSVDTTSTTTRVGGGHRGDAGAGAQLPDHRRRRLRGLEAVRDAPRRCRGRPEGAHPRGQPDGAQRLRRRPGQEDQAHPRLPDDHRPELRRGAARDRLAAADGEAQVATPVNWQQGEDVIIAGSVSDDEAREI